MQPIPTPYDITELPTFAIEVPGLWWLTLFGFVLLQALMVSAVLEYRRQRTIARGDPFDFLKKEILIEVNQLEVVSNTEHPENLIYVEQFRQPLDRIALLLRQIESIITSKNVLALTQKEISELNPDSKTVGALNLLDTLRFQTSTDISTLKSLIEIIKGATKSIDSTIRTKNETHEPARRTE